MGIGKPEQPPIDNPEKPRAKPLWQRFRLLRQRLIIPEEASAVPWEQWKQTIIENRHNGIPEELAPERFTVSKGLVDTFQEMLPIKYPGRIDDKVFSEAARKAKAGLEVARSLIVDTMNNRLLVHVQNGGEAELTPNASKVRHRRAKGQIGALHTHPNGDHLPSSGDIFNFLHHNQTVGIIVTPYRVITLFRTNKTPTFTNPIIAKGYIEGMGKAKGRDINKAGLWTFKYSDLNELHILGYEAERIGNVFVRRDNAK